MTAHQSRVYGGLRQGASEWPCSGSFGAATVAGYSRRVARTPGRITAAALLITIVTATTLLLNAAPPQATTKRLVPPHLEDANVWLKKLADEQAKAAKDT